ncbi:MULTISPECIES: AraC family transcriptional regulator [Paenibacillus]|uniref:DNA-binding response regulator n=1 Tax=Paenibacillus albilobatus TaxID=2716884 RepID=A0A919XKT6_9BACL|nr:MULTISPECIES: response regulator [Paenibacillus]MDR9852093.1 response regulator [Paenibacillus sp. VCA1]GIO32655.1 hypothetical protein J2TS6_37960 [Paenibacillus albilobatus]
MYQAMLVDDDYPVIELLSETIDWDGHGFTLSGAYENGEEAWEVARKQPPDVLITDIGMPRMNGLELIARIKEIKPELKVVILSCHSEFQYAQQAVRLNVQDYLIKDVLDPQELNRLMNRFKQMMDGERRAGWEHSRLKHLMDETRELRKERCFKNLIHQPLLAPEKWRRETEEYGLFKQGESCLPVIGFVEDYRQVKYRFASDQTLQFAIGNVMNEMLRDGPLSGLHVSYDVRTSLLLFSYRPGLKVNIHDEAAACLRMIRETVMRVLKISMSFICGGCSPGPAELKQELNELLEGREQRFYLERGEIAKKARTAEKPHDNHLFAYYDEACSGFRDALLRKNSEQFRKLVDGWMERIRREKYPAETVKDWTLKLLLDVKLKLHAIPHLTPSNTADMLHKEAADLDSLHDLRGWLIGHLESLAGAQAGSVRPEVTEACKYVALRLGSRITLDEVAEHLHLNPSYFSRLFKKETGLTFIEYVTKQKMERAKELLDGTRFTVGDICEQLGYDNQSYFIKTFKLHTGQTPIGYRG